MSPNGHTEGSVDPFHRIWVASKIKQHLCVVKQEWILHRAIKKPKEKLTHKNFYVCETPEIIHSFFLYVLLACLA